MRLDHGAADGQAQSIPGGTDPVVALKPFEEFFRIARRQARAGVADLDDGLVAAKGGGNEDRRSRQGVLGADMETAALFTIGSLRGFKTASILNNVVAFEQDTLESIGSYVSGENLAMQGERHEILTALEALCKVFIDE